MNQTDRSYCFRGKIREEDTREILHQKFPIEGESVMQLFSAPLTYSRRTSSIVDMHVDPTRKGWSHVSPAAFFQAATPIVVPSRQLSRTPFNRILSSGPHDAQRLFIFRE